MHPELLREYLVKAIDIVCRRWLVFAVPLLIALALAITAVKMAPLKYTAKSLILLQGASKSARSNNWVQQRIAAEQRLFAAEQVAAMEAWLKSDQVLEDLLFEFEENDHRAHQLSIGAAAALRGNLALELISSSMLEIRLEGPTPKGLGRKLEIIVARLMEGLTVPEKNIHSAPQFVLLRHQDEVAEANNALQSAIMSVKLGPPEKVRAQLEQLHSVLKQMDELMQSKHEDSDPAHSASSSTSEIDVLAATASKIRRSIAEDVITEQELEKLYTVYLEAQARYEQLRVRMPNQLSNYVSIFDAPENLLVIGQPADPTAGESSAKKLVIAGLLLSFLASAGLVFLVEMLAGPLRTRGEFEAASGLPVVARIGKRPRVGDVMRAQTATQA
jgi:hypothetical protein